MGDQGIIGIDRAMASARTKRGTMHRQRARARVARLECGKING